MIIGYTCHTTIITDYRVADIINDSTTTTSAATTESAIMTNTTTVPPTLLTCFIALQDIVNVEMGPTIFLPNTHTQYAHEQFAQDTIPHSATITTPNSDHLLSPKDILLRDSPSIIGTLTKGYVWFITSYLCCFEHCD